MSRVEKIIVFALVCICIIAMLALKAGADTAGSYGVAEFHNPVNIPRDGLVERWVLDPGLTGDMTTLPYPAIGDEVWSGDLELWDGSTYGGCTDRPEGFLVNCASYGGDVNSDTTYIYRSNTSARLDATGVFHSVVYYTLNFEANTAYQISICYKGHDGTEDFIFAAANGSLTETYNFATDTWTAALTYSSKANIGTGWSCGSWYITTGAVAKDTYIVTASAGSGDGSYIYIDNWVVRELDTEGIVGERGNILSVPVTADPVFGESPELMHKPGSGLATDRGMELDGTDDYMSRADDDTFDPSENTGHFSFGGRYVVNDTSNGNQWIYAKDTSGANRSWVFYNGDGDDARTIWFDATGTSDNAAINNVVIDNALNGYVFTYHFDGDGSSRANGYFNASTVAVTTGEGPTRNVASPLTIGSDGSGSNTLGGSSLEFAYWNKELSSVDANKFINPYFPATNHGQGFYVDTCDQAASHATCTLDKCRDGTPNACQAEGTGTMAIFGQYTELCDDNSFETLTGDDSNPDFTHWEEDEDPDGQTATITAYRADKKHGDVSARLITSGADAAVPAVELMSGCETVGVGSDMYIEASIKKLSGTANFRIGVSRYVDGVCSSGVGVHGVYGYADIEGGKWQNVSGLMEAGDWATANSYKIQLINFNSDADLLIDNVSVKVVGYHTPWVHNAGAGSTTYNARDYRLHNPLSDRSDLLREDMYESGWCMSAWVYTDWEGDDGSTHYFALVPGTAGNNNRWYWGKLNTDKLTFLVTDNAGGNRYYELAATSTNWSVGWHYIEACTDNADNVLDVHHYNLSNSTWYDWSTGGSGGTGIVSDQNSELHLGHASNASHVDGYIPNFHIVPYSATYPNEGFHAGNPPINSKPY